jgi:2,3-bisphosphoglycerate-independent phosphoglycerate mutase
MNANGKTSETIDAAINEAYKNKETDEFFKPRVIDGYSGIRNNDSIIMFNYRLDRARQLTQAIIDPKFKEFGTRKPKGLRFCSMTEYYKELGKNSSVSIAFPRKSMKNNLGEWLSRSGKKQLRCAETEKFAHVTYFFNGQKEAPFKGEDRVLVPSPRIATYDLQPVMSAQAVKNNVIAGIKSGKYDLIVVNFANPDMVGHTGFMNEAVKAVEEVDFCIGDILSELKAVNGSALIISDHGNCEEMSGIHKTSHTTNKVPCIYVDYTKNTWKKSAKTGRTNKKVKLNNGRLADVAPTILEMMHMDKPKEMTGQSLIVKK